MKRIFLWLALLLLVTAGIATAQDDVLHVDASQDLGPISPYVYGMNYGTAGIITPALMPQAQALGLKYLRIGSNRSDDVDLDVGGIDLFVSQAHQLGAEPAITVRLLDGTPEKAAEIVHYANIEKGYKVRFWSIGNEPNDFVPVHHAPSYTSEDLNQQWRAIAEAMLAVDPTITFVGPDITQYMVANADPDNIQYMYGNLGPPRDANGKDLMQEFLRANGDLLGIVTIHRYPFGSVGSNKKINLPTFDTMRENPKEWDTANPNLRQIIKDTTGRNIPIGVTEVNSNQIASSGGEVGVDSHYNAIWLGEVLGRLIRQQVALVAYWLIRTPTEGSGIFGRDDLRPTYYTYLMYTHFGTELLKSDWTNPDVSIYAAKRDDGTLTLMVINMGREEATKTLKLDGFTPSGQAEVWRFDADHNAEQIDSQEIASGSITVPGQSLTLYVIPAGT